MKWSWEKVFVVAGIGWAAAILAACYLPVSLGVRCGCVVALLLPAIWLSLRWTWWLARVPAQIPVFLMLHSVSDAVVDESCANNSIRPQELARLIVDLKAAGYVFQTATEAAEKPLRRSVVITFDDGYVDNYKYLFPILKQHQVKATCFITNRGSADSAFLTPEQVREMYASGLVEFGGHTVAHSVLDTLTLEEAEVAIRENVKWLTEVLGVAPVSFAYPCGGYNDAIVDLVKAAGYRYAFTMHKRMRPVAPAPYHIHRQIIPRDKTPLQNYLLATRGKYKV